MRNVTHELVGVTCALGASRTLDVDALDTAAMSAGAVIGAWLPDADRLGTRVHRPGRLGRRSTAARAVGMVLRLPLVVFALVARHRGISHSLFACALVGVLATVLGLWLPAPGAACAGGLAVGYGAHALADACTPAGVALWAPFSRRRAWLVPRRARIRTGSPREGLFAVATAATALVLALA